MMSTECVPLSISTPPPLIAGLLFQRPIMSTGRVERVLEQDDLAERAAGDHRLGLVTSSTKRNFEAIVTSVRCFSLAARISRALAVSIASGFSHSTGMPRDEEGLDDCRVRGRRRAHDDRVEVAAVGHLGTR